MRLAGNGQRLTASWRWLVRTEARVGGSEPPEHQPVRPPGTTRACVTWERLLGISRQTGMLNTWQFVALAPGAPL